MTETPYDPDLCGEIIRTGNTVWVCVCPRENHPTQPTTRYGGLSHRMINRAALDQSREATE